MSLVIPEVNHNHKRNNILKAIALVVSVVCVCVVAKIYASKQ